MKHTWVAVLGLALGAAQTACSDASDGGEAAGARPAAGLDVPSGGSPPRPASGGYVGMQVGAADGSEVLRFSGIRYAQPPVGNSRWRAPTPAKAPKQPIEATGWPPICIQGNGTLEWYDGVATAFGHPFLNRPHPDGRAIFPPQPQMAEDCLFLNIWTPDVAARLPVMVWIHGGGNVNGWSFEPNYRGRELAAKGAVVVSINYRLGVFGFLAHPALSAEAPRPSSGNYGILDQMEALRWLQRHIHQFGGDPGNVTLFGESAGAGDIAYLLVSPLARGLFHRAISQSGGWPVNQRRTLAEDEAEGVRFLASAGMDGIEALRTVPAEALFELAEAHFIRGYDDPPVDGWLLPAPPADLLAAKAVGPAPVIIGVNAQEMLMDVQDATEDDWREALEEAPNSRALSALLAPLPLRERLGVLLSAATFVCPSIALADGLVSAGVPTYFYRFDRVRPGDHGLGAYHGAEIPYLFNTHDYWLPTTTTDRALTEQMMAYWLRFAAAGDPNHPHAPHWPGWTANGLALVLDEEVRAGPLEDAICGLLESR